MRIFIVLGALALLLQNAEGYLAPRLNVSLGVYPRAQLKSRIADLTAHPPRKRRLVQHVCLLGPLTNLYITPFMSHFLLTPACRPLEAR